MKKVILGIFAVIVCVSLVGCWNTQEIKNEEPVIDNQTTTKTNTAVESANTEETARDLVESLPEEELNNVKEEVKDIGLASDDTKFVFKTDETTTGIFYHNGNEITGYEVRIEYESKEDAELAKASYTDYEEDDVESLTVDGKTLIVKYKPEAYSDMTYEGIKQTYSILQVLQEN